MEKTKPVLLSSSCNSCRSRSTIREADDPEYPSNAMVWPGCLIASIAHAVFVAKMPFMAHEQSWDGRNYNVQDSAGSRGTIAFAEDKNHFVGVAYLQTSVRDPLGGDPHKANETDLLLRDVPDELKPLSEEALQYVLQDVNGQVIPVITAAFWSDVAGSRVTSGEPWPDVVQHGAVLFEKQMLPPDVALKEWTQEFEFDCDEIALTEALFRRRLTNASGLLQLTPARLRQVHSMASGDEGLQECRVSLGEIGIVLP